ncbi:MAG: TolC family protein [Acidobacteria bacterium]|nr:TolC family protein [Acidobacteriota bacterium]
MTVRHWAAALLLSAAASSAFAQTVPGPFLGSVPQGTASAEPVALSLRDALDRGLQFNLGLLLQEESSRTAHGARWRTLSELLPRVSGSVSERRQVINLEAFGFPAPEPIVGPFNVFDARIGLSQRIVDLARLNADRASVHRARAEDLGIRSARELVVLVAVNLYLEAVTASSRIDAVRAQLETAEALQRQATNLKDSGLVAGIDVLRAQVQVQQQRQRLIVAENDRDRAHLQLARAIGLPPGQAVTLTDAIPFAPLENVTLETALTDALDKRADLQAARDLVAAAEAEARAASLDRLPTLSVDADYGTIGQTVSAAHTTYAVAAVVRVPLFEGGRNIGARQEAQARLRQRRAELDDLRGRVDLDVRTAFLDVRAAAQQVEAADVAVTLANQELVQARDRFAAGVASNIEVTQAQQSVATASDARIEALYHHNVAKATLARAVGSAEAAVTSFLAGVQ